MEPLEQIPNRKRRLRCLNVAHPSLATLMQPYVPEQRRRL